MYHSGAAVVDELHCAGFMLLMKSLTCLRMGTLSLKLGGVELPKKATAEKLSYRFRSVGLDVW